MRQSLCEFTWTYRGSAVGLDKNGGAEMLRNFVGTNWGVANLHNLCDGTSKMGYNTEGTTHSVDPSICVHRLSNCLKLPGNY